MRFQSNIAVFAGYVKQERQKNGSRLARKPSPVRFFVEKAPKNLVKEQREKLEKFQEKLNMIDEAIGKLSNK